MKINLGLLALVMMAMLILAYANYLCEKKIADKKIPQCGYCKHQMHR